MAKRVLQDKRTSPLCIRLTDDERALLDELAEQRKESMVGTIVAGLRKLKEGA